MMKYRILGRTGLKVSRLGLGTAELGFAYGIGPRTVPTDAEADCLLKLAVDMGINFFDTANIHQLADERIAKSGIAKIPGVIIATKCGHFLEKGEDPPRHELEKRLRSEVEANLRNLKVDVLSVLQLHGGTREQIERGDVVEIMSKFKNEGKAQFIGISTRGEDVPIVAIQSGGFDVINVAFSILDQRMAQRVLPWAFVNGVGVICRSALLKGALTDLVNLLPENLSWLKKNAHLARIIAEDEVNCDLPELAIRFAVSETAISTVLVGTNKYSNLGRAVIAANRKPLRESIRIALRGLAIDDPMQVDPAKWPRF